MDTMSRVQTLDKAVCISRSTKTLLERYASNILQSATRQGEGKLFTLIGLSFINLTS